MSEMHDTLPPEPTHEPIHTAHVTITFNLSLEASFAAAQEVERLVKSYTQGQLKEDIQDGFTNWCANIECAEDKELDFALDLPNLKLDITVPPAKTQAQEAKEKAAKAQRAARNAMIRSLLAQHRATMAQVNAQPHLKLVTTPTGYTTRHKYTTPEERDEARKARYNATRDERNARRRAARAAKKNNPS